MPERIQRSRAKGWRMPAGAVYVGRPTKWGNPFKVGAYNALLQHQMDRREAVDAFRRRLVGVENWWAGNPRRLTLTTVAEVRGELRGKDLVCWCPLDEPCHADVLLEWANG